MGPSKEKWGKSFTDSCLLCLARQPPPHLPRVPSPTSQVKTLECPQLPLIRLTFHLGRLSSCTITHAIFPPDNRFFCVLLTQTYKAPLCCFQKSLCCRNNSQTCQTHIGSPPPSFAPSPDPEARKQPPGLPGTCVCLPTLPRWKLTLHFTLLLTM